MLNAIKAVARNVDERVGWNRIGAGISVLIVAIAGYTLFHLLRDIEVGKVFTAIESKSPRTLAIAACFVAIGFVTLTFYDLFSLRTIGRHDVPYRVAAFASFTSYSIGHNLGATVFTANVVRHRIYSAWGLTVVDIAKIAFVTGLTFWLGNVFVLGVSMVYAPEIAGAVSQLPAWMNRALAIGALAVIGGYILWLLPRPRVIGRDNWQVTLPNARLTLVQIGIGILDLGAGALAIYMLLPPDAPVDVVTVLVVFVIAMLLGFLSHAPGSLGVFEAALLIGLPQIEKEQLLAAALIFRVMYFVVPLFLASALLAGREALCAVRRSRAAQKGGSACST